MTNTRDKIKIGQIEDILWEYILQKPTTLQGYGITDALTEIQSNNRYVRFDTPQELSESQQLQARVNIGVTPVITHDPVSLGLQQNGLSLSEQVLSLALVTTSNAGAMSVADKIKLDGIANNANNYVHPTQLPIDTNELTGKSVISRIIVNTLGHVVGISTRTDLPYVDFTSAETITGLKTIRRAGSTTLQQRVLSFEIGGDDLHKLDLVTSQNVLTPAGEVIWSFRMTENVLGLPQQHHRIGFYRGGITILGDRLPSQQLANEISSHVNQTTQPFAFSTFIQRSAMVANSLWVGLNSLHGTTHLLPNDKIYTTGRVYATQGIRTTDPSTNSVQGTIWKFGKAAETVDSTINRIIEVSIDGTVYELLARIKGTQPNPENIDPVDPIPTEKVLLDYFGTSSGISGNFFVNQSEVLLNQHLNVGDSVSGELVLQVGEMVTLGVLQQVGVTSTVQVVRTAPTVQVLYHQTRVEEDNQFSFTPQANERYSLHVHLFTGPL